MSLYIKEMKMPTSCYCCPFFHMDLHYTGNDDLFERYTCLRTGEQTEEIIDRHMNNCPIIFVPTHGRLIDENWLRVAMITTLEELKKNPKMDGQKLHLIAAFETLRTMIEKAPTVIDAD